jgi:hypothetical protein
MQVAVISGAGNKLAPSVTTEYSYGDAAALRHRGLSELYLSKPKRRFTLTVVAAGYNVGDKLTLSTSGEVVDTVIKQVEHLVFEGKSLSRITCEAAID